MPMSVVYETVNGRLVEENRGGVVTRYLPDTLGSVIKTADVNGNITSETTYWPFGEVRTQVGTNPSPWGFCGIWGYLQDAAARLYVRARYLRADLGRWMAVDPVWPGESAYNYVRARPTELIDPSGRLAQLGPDFGAGLAACSDSGATSWIVGSWIGGDSPTVAWCKAGLKCFLDALRAAIIVLFPALGGLINCAIAGIAALLKLAADKLCPCLNNNCCELTVDWCDGIKLAADAATGCLGALGSDEFKEIFGDALGAALATFINGVTRGAAGIACKGAVDLVRA